MFLIVILILVLIYVIKTWTKGICKSSVCLVGKTAIITGANSGLGYQTALNLASRGCKVIMADKADMEESKLKIIKYTNNENIVTKKLDLFSLQSVKDFAADVIATTDRLDILVNNAGIGTQFHSKQQPKINSIMQVNYFGHFLLTHLLLDLLKKSAPSKIIFTSSLFAYFHNLTADNLCSESGKSVASELQAYCNSKLAMLVASDVLAEKLKGSNVTSNAVHPGFVTTGIFVPLYNLGLGVKILLKTLEFIFGKDTWEGSQTLVYAAVSKKLDKVSGKFLCDCMPFRKPSVAYDPEFCRKIWDASVKYVGLEECDEVNCEASVKQ